MNVQQYRLRFSFLRHYLDFFFFRFKHSKFNLLKKFNNALQNIFVHYKMLLLFFCFISLLFNFLRVFYLT